MKIEKLIDELRKSRRPCPHEPRCIKNLIEYDTLEQPKYAELLTERFCKVFSTNVPKCLPLTAENSFTCCPLYIVQEKARRGFPQRLNIVHLEMDVSDLF